MTDLSFDWQLGQLPVAEEAVDGYAECVGYGFELNVRCDTLLSFELGEAARIHVDTTQLQHLDKSALLHAPLLAKLLNFSAAYVFRAVWLLSRLHVLTSILILFRNYNG